MVKKVSSQNGSMSNVPAAPGMRFLFGTLFDPMVVVLICWKVAVLATAAVVDLPVPTIVVWSQVVEAAVFSAIEPVIPAIENEPVAPTVVPSVALLSTAVDWF